MRLCICLYMYVLVCIAVTLMSTEYLLPLKIITFFSYHPRLGWEKYNIIIMGLSYR